MGNAGEKEPVRNGAARKSFQASRVSSGEHYAGHWTVETSVPLLALARAKVLRSNAPGGLGLRMSVLDMEVAPWACSNMRQRVRAASTHHRTRPASSQRLAAIRNERRQT